MARITRGGITLGPGPAEGVQSTAVPWSVAPFHHSARQCAASLNTASITSARSRSARISDQPIDQQIERRANLVGVVHADVAPDVGRARRQPRGIDEPLPLIFSPRPSRPCLRFHQRRAASWGRWLMSDIRRSCSAADMVVGRAPGPYKGGQAVDGLADRRGPRASAGGVKIQGRR